MQWLFMLLYKFFLLCIELVVVDNVVLCLWINLIKL